MNAKNSSSSPAVSVVVPIYNASRYLDQALASIEDQTLRELEIICVNDGSTDNSLDIIRRHAEYDPRIIVVDKPNEGYGASCNRGIDMAQGEWIAIVEPDDWIEPGMCADMLAFADSFAEPVDIVKTPYWRIADADTPQERKVACSYKAAMKGCRNPFAIGERTQLMMHHPSIWSAVYRRDFLYDAGIRFLPIPGAGWADNPFLVETLCRAKAIAYLDEAYYCYRAETPEKSNSFFRDSYDVPIKRWHEMADALESIGMSDRRIWEAQCHRGFLYASNILKERSIDDPDVENAIKSIFDRMRPEIVAEMSSVPPRMRELYSSMTGNSIPANKARYRAHLLKSGLYSVRNIGLKETLRLMKA